MKKNILIFLTLLFLSGCAKHLAEGTVIEKHYVEAHNTYSPIVMIVNKRTQIIPRWIRYSDRWYISVEMDNIQDQWDVTEEFYNSIKIGDWVSREARQK